MDCEMDAQTRIDTEALVAEILGYLTLVEALRAFGYEPTWQPEGRAVRRARKSARPLDEPVRSRQPRPPRFTV
jgi:hypothetical protein